MWAVRWKRWLYFPSVSVSSCMPVMFQHLTILTVILVHCISMHFKINKNFLYKRPLNASHDKYFISCSAKETEILYSISLWNEALKSNEDNLKHYKKCLGSSNGSNVSCWSLCFQEKTRPKQSTSYVINIQNWSRANHCIYYLLSVI